MTHIRRTQGGALTVGVVALTLGTSAWSRPDETPAPAPVAAAPVDQTEANATRFHLLDFVAWNNRDLDVFRRLHTPDVHVEFGGVTNGIDAHVHALQPYWQPGSELVSHGPIIAEREWTCMVGTGLPPTSAKMVTVAKWRNGAISEEYILVNLLPAGAAKPAVSGAPEVTIANTRPDMKALVGAEMGWSCSLERTAEGKMVISVLKAGGTAAEQMIFTS